MSKAGGKAKRPRLAVAYIGVIAAATLAVMPLVLGPALVQAAPAAAAVSSGNGQTGNVGTTLPDPLVVTVTNASGEPEPGVVVHWDITSAPSGATGASLSDRNITTDANGQASVELTLGDKTGTYTVQAMASGLPNSPVTFTETAVAAAASSVSLTSGGGQSASISSTLASPFVVTVSDAEGRPVSGRVVTWSITSAPAGASGMNLSATSTSTDADGGASTVLTLGNRTGTYEVQAVASGLEGSPVTFTATASAAAVTKPMGLTPGDRTKLSSMTTTLTWSQDPATRWFEIRVVPFNSDGPGIDLIISDTDQVAGASYAVQAPDFGADEPNYVMLPDISYTWQVRTAVVTNPPANGDWSAFSDPMRFETPNKFSDTISLLGPIGGAGAGSLTPTLRWDNSDENVFYYEVQVSRDSGFCGTSGCPMLYWELKHAGLTDPLDSYTIPSGFPLEAGRTYFWRVRPRVQGDGSPVAWTPTASFRVP